MHEGTEEQQNQLIKVDWTKLTQNTESNNSELLTIVTERLTAALTDPNKYSSKHVGAVAQLVVQSISELQKVFSVDKKINITITKAQFPLKSFFDSATFRLGENDEFSIELSGTILEACVLHLKTIEAYTQIIQDLNEDEQSLRPIYQDIIDTFAVEYSRLLATLAHEMYHARQASQHRLYFLKTAAANTLSRMIGAGILNKTEAQQRLKKDPYTGDRGENSATALGIRYLREKVKVIQSKPKEEQSMIEKLILIGAQKTITSETEQLAQRAQVTGWDTP